MPLHLRDSAVKSPIGRVNGRNIGTQLPLNPPVGKEPPKMVVSGRSHKFVPQVAGLRPTRGKRSAATRGLNGRARV